jgi:D-alanine-D-alanine ligase
MKSGARVAVLMGGPSDEHEISLKSGRGVVDALVRRGWLAQPLVIPKRDVGGSAAVDFTRDALAGMKPDAVFIALHGTFGEDGMVQSLCEELSLPYTGSSSTTSRIGIDKALSKDRFRAAGLTVPASVLLKQPTPPESLSLVYPVVIKPASQGSSLGVSIVRQPHQLEEALATAFRYGSAVLVEAFIAGRELTVGVLGDDALPVIEVKPKHAFFDFTAKYTVGLTEYLVPAPLDASVAVAVQEAGLWAHRALGCRHLSRTDIILPEDGAPVVLEVNTIPGFTPTSLLPKAAAYVGLTYDELCEQIVLMAMHDAESPLALGQG